MKTVEMARVLLVDDNPASRLTLQTLLQAGGYSVDAAASAAEAVGKLDEQEYELVLSDLGMESPEAGYRVIAHARRMDYSPATALITKDHDESEPVYGSDSTLVEPEDVQGLFTQVADLISARARRRVRRQMRHTAA
ncbi:MAG: response regulator [Bryobacterales bacterium]|nr:response regulator [Bryobacterales bacterium]